MSLRIELGGGGPPFGGVPWTHGSLSKSPFVGGEGKVSGDRGRVRGRLTVPGFWKGRHRVHFSSTRREVWSGSYQGFQGDGRELVVLSDPFLSVDVVRTPYFCSGLFPGKYGCKEVRSSLTVWSRQRDDTGAGMTPVRSGLRDPALCGRTRGRPS